jgi:predicted amidohydrolase
LWSGQISYGNSDLKTLKRTLDQEVNLLKANLEIMQAGVYKQRFAGFEQVDATGMHRYDRALADMLKGGKVLDSQEILGGLGIDPRDSQATSLRSLKGSACSESRPMGGGGCDPPG